jgi:hypothetical protein
MTSNDSNMDTKTTNSNESNMDSKNTNRNESKMNSKSTNKDSKRNRRKGDSVAKYVRGEVPRKTFYKVRDKHKCLSANFIFCFISAISSFCKSSCSFFLSFQEVPDKKLRTRIKRSEKDNSEAALSAAKAEILLPSEHG